jgi:hypothetical protein
MKTVKATLIVIATIIGAYFLFDLVTGIFFAYQDSKAESESFTMGLELDSKIEELAKSYAGKKVNINSWDNSTNEYLEVPVWQIYKYNKVGSLRNGDKVTLLEVDINDSKGKKAKIRMKDGFEGYITYWYIDEFEEAKKLDPLLITEY